MQGNNQTLISILIPTYNRPELLKKLLQNIVYLCKFEINSGLIEIVISDNSTNNLTQSIVKNISSIHNTKIIYNRNNNNIGFGANLFAAHNLASGRYLWFVSDDNIIYLKSINDLIVFLLLQNPDLVSFNTLGFNNYESIHVRYLKSGYRKFKSPQEFFLSQSLKITQLSCHIFKKSAGSMFLNKFLSKSEYYCSDLIHTENIINICMNSNKIYFFNPLVVFSLRKRNIDYSYTDILLLSFIKLLKNKNEIFNNKFLNKYITNCFYSDYINYLSYCEKLEMEKFYTSYKKIFKGLNFSLGLLILMSHVNSKVRKVVFTLISCTYRVFNKPIYNWINII